MSGEIRDECGVFGIWGNDDAPTLTYWGIFSLQHRGQESAGIAVWDGQRIRVAKGMGLVNEVLTIPGGERGERHPVPAGWAAVGHVRYSTHGASDLSNAQPLLMESRFGTLALAHNGNLVNALEWRQRLADAGALFQGTGDSEVLAHLIARSQRPTLVEAMVEGLQAITGGFAFLVLSASGLLAARDPLGIRPLVLGRLGDKWVVASETCALDIVSASYVRDVEPGELIVIDDGGMRSERFSTSRERALCAFENVYFSRADSRINGVSAHSSRRNLGRMLGREAPAEVDLVVGVPDSSLPQAMGYAETLGVDFDLGLVKNRYVARTFIAPTPEARRAAVGLKLSAVPEVIQGKRIALVDDSLVRGTTARHIIQLLRRSGAREVHMRIASPPYLNPCHYGIDTSRPDELIANQQTLSAITGAIGADSLAYLSEEGMLQALGGGGWCTACFGGRYPVAVAPAPAQQGGNSK